ncbi:hypothetical protein [Hymenobacter amundsenii]|uniref:hypothetical protein n=1 Tax=Hymenobacter amundsenii TaxID=2006685 RepID=UPI000F828C95|nr:hypothetical protein [Hymenobacter amundsenii]
MKVLFLCLLLLTYAASTGAQTVLQGDSIYRGLQVGKSNLDDVQKNIGRRYKSEKIVGKSTAMAIGGGCITKEVLLSVLMQYHQRGITAHISKNIRRKNKLEELDFNVNSNIQSAKGIQPDIHTFADVIARYGLIDFDEKSNSAPKLVKYSNSVSLIYPKIQFISYGASKAEENVLLRKVEIIKLIIR